MEKRLFFKMLEDQRKIIENKKFNGDTSEQLAKDLNNYNAMLKFAYFYSEYPTTLSRQENFELVEEAVAQNGFHIKRTAYTTLVLIARATGQLCSHLVNFNFQSAYEVSSKLYEFGDNVVEYYENNLITMAYNDYSSRSKLAKVDREM